MSNPDVPDSVHYKVGVLTRQLHDSLNELGYADRLRGSMGELPDAQSRLSYIARLTGEAAEKVLNRVELAKRSEEHTSELQSQSNLVCRLLLEKKKNRPGRL